MKLTYLMAVSFRSQPAFLPSVACAARNCANPGELTKRSMPEIFGRPQSRTMTSALTAASSEPSNEAPSPKLVFPRSLPLVAKTRVSLEYHSSVSTRRRQRTKHADVNGILDRQFHLPALHAPRWTDAHPRATGSYPP